MSESKYFYEFENFRLDAKNQSLWRGETLVSISPKALEILILLVEKRGEIVSRDELLAVVWKDTFVEEGNINYTISLLRKTLENKTLIQTVPRRGYRFVADLKEISPNDKVLSKSAVNARSQKNPFRWIFSSILLISLLFLTSFAIWWRSYETIEKTETTSTQNSDAMQAYRRGKMILEKKSVENREEKAIDEFQNAITLDPTFALAYAGLAEGYSALAVIVSHPNSAENYAKAKIAAEKSLALDENLAEGWLIRGWLKRQADWDWTNAESDLRRSIQINPKNAVTHLRLALLLSSIGKQTEALAEIRTAQELDPIADYVVGGRFPILEARREYDQALQESEQFSRENKANNSAARAYATFLYHTGNFGKTIELGEESMANHSPKNAFAWFSLLAASYAKTGQTDSSNEALRKLENLAANDTKALYSLAMNYAETGRADDAIQALQKCFQLREERMFWLNVEPRFENLRGDRRFLEIIREMRLAS